MTLAHPADAASVGPAKCPESHKRNGDAFCSVPFGSLEAGLSPHDSASRNREQAAGSAGRARSTTGAEGGAR